MKPSSELTAELLGTALLVAIVIGSGIMAERLADGNEALALLANTAATVAGLFVLIEVLGPISGAHFNPAVTMVLAIEGTLPTSRVVPYVLAQFLGALAGALLAHAMFEVDLVQTSTRTRHSWGIWIGELVATAGLILVVLRSPAGRASALVAAYIGAAYWFTSSTSFANPAVTLGRMMSDSFAGIAPQSVPLFGLAQALGAALALGLNRLLGR